MNVFYNRFHPTIKKCVAGVITSLVATAAQAAPINVETYEFTSSDYGGANVNYGVYEVKRIKYHAFLNAVAASDPYGLYNPKMVGITQNGVSGSFTYSLDNRYRNYPINYVSFWDAARFCNWLTTGNTESGVYDLATNAAHISLSDWTDPNVMIIAVSGSTATWDDSVPQGSITIKAIQIQRNTAVWNATYASSNTPVALMTKEEWERSAYDYETPIGGAPVPNFDYYDSGDFNRAYRSSDKTYEAYPARYGVSNGNHRNSGSYDGITISGNSFGHYAPYGLSNFWIYKAPRSGHYLVDQSGNVAEWTESFKNNYSFYTLGGSKNDHTEIGQSSSGKAAHGANTESEYLGFRVISLGAID